MPSSCACLAVYPPKLMSLRLPFGDAQFTVMLKQWLKADLGVYRLNPGQLKHAWYWHFVKRAACFSASSKLSEALHALQR